MTNVALYTALALATAVVLLFLARLHSNKDSPFDLVQLVKEPGEDRLSLSRTSTLAALVVSTWAFVWLTVHDKLSEWYFAAYMLTWTGKEVLTRMKQS